MTRAARVLVTLTALLVLLTGCAKQVAGPTQDQLGHELDRIGVPLPGATLLREEARPPKGCAAECTVTVDRDYAVAGFTYQSMSDTLAATLKHDGYTAGGPTTCAVVVDQTKTSDNSPYVWCSSRATSSQYSVTVLGRLTGVDLTPYAPLPSSGGRGIPADQQPPLTAPIDLVEITIDGLPQPTPM